MSVTLQPGTLLVASPKLADNPHFAQRVILILRHSGDTGTAGVVINRPLDQDHVAEHQQYLTTGLEHLWTPENRLVFVGGPMQPHALVVLHRVEHLGVGQPLLENIYHGGDLEALRSHARSLDSEQSVLRFYLGFAIWDSGQLENEVGKSFWSLSPGLADLVFSSRPDQVWQQLLSSSDGG